MSLIKMNVVIIAKPDRKLFPMQRSLASLG